MANNRVVVNFDFKANTQDIQTQLNSLKTNLQQIIGQSSKINIGGHINTQLKDAVGAAQSLQKHLTASFNTNTGQLDLAKFNASLKSSNQNVTMLGKQLLGAGAEGKAAFMGLATSLVQAEIPAVKLSTTMGKLMTTFANNARWMISSSVLTGFISGIREAVDYTKDLNESLTDIRIVTGKSKEEMDRLAKSANKMAKELKTSTAEIVKGQLIYYQQGDSAELAAKKAEITTKAANVSFGTSQEQMSEYLTAIWNSYQVGEENLEQFVDVLAAVGATTATSMEEIATAMQKVAATGNAVGVSYEQLTATIATISSITRTSSEQVGTALKTIYARIGDLKAGGLDEDDIGLGQVSSGLKKVGVEILDTNNNIRDMGEVVEEIGTKWEGWTEAQQQTIVQLIAGKRQYTQMMALFDNWDMYESTLATAEGADGELNKQQEIWAESWEAASQNVQASLESLYSQIFDDDVFIDFLNGLNLIIEGIDGITDLFGGLGNTLLILSTLLVQRFSIPLADGLRNAAMQAKLLFDFKNKGYQETESQVAKMLDSIKALSSEEQAQLNNLKQEIELKTKYANLSGQLNQSQKQEYATSMQILQILQNRYQEQSKTLDLAKKEASVLVNNAKQNFKNDKVDYQKDRYSTILSNYEKAFLNEFKEYPEIQSQVEAIFNEFKEGGISIDQTRTKLNAMLNELGGEGTSSHFELKSMFGDFENSAKFAGDRLRELDILLEQLDAPFLSENSANQFNGQTLDQAIQKYGQLSGTLEYYKSGLNNMKLNTEDAKARQSQLNTVLSAAELIYQGNDEKIKRLTKSLMSADLSSEEFEAILKQINQDLAGKISTADQDFKEIADMLNSAGVEGEELAAIIDKIKSGAILTEAEIDKLNGKFRQTKKDLETPSAKGWSNWAMDISTAMMSIMSIINAAKSAFDTFNNPDATGWEKFSAVMSVITTILMSVSMLYPVVSSIVVAGNTAMAASAAGTATAAQAMWASILGPIGILVAALALVTVGIVALGFALHETNAEKIERLTEETKQLKEEISESEKKIQELKDKKAETNSEDAKALALLNSQIEHEEREAAIREKILKAKERELEVAKAVQANAEMVNGTIEQPISRIDRQSYLDVVNDTTLSQEERDEAMAYLNSADAEFDLILNEWGEKLSNPMIDANALRSGKAKLYDALTEYFALDSDEILSESEQDNLVTKLILGDNVGDLANMTEEELQKVADSWNTTLGLQEEELITIEDIQKAYAKVNEEYAKTPAQKLAKSVEDMGKAVEKVQSSFQEVEKNGFLAYSTIEELGKTMSAAGVAGVDEWKQALYDANGNAEKTKEILGQITGAITDATIEAQNFSKNLDFDENGNLTAESQQLITNTEKLIAAQLRENGVLNAEEEARKRVTAAVLKETIAKNKTLTVTKEETANLLAMAKSANLSANQITVLSNVLNILNNTNFSMEKKAEEILKLGKASIASSASVIALQKLLDSTDDTKGLKPNVLAFGPNGQAGLPGFRTTLFSGKVPSAEELNSAVNDVVTDLMNNALNIANGLTISNTGGSGGGNNEPYWKQMYETNVARAEFLQKRDGLTDEWLGQQMDYWYNEYVKGHELELKDPKTGETWEEYSFDEQKKATEKKKSGVKKVFEDAIKDIERNSDSINMGRVSTLLSDTLNKQTELGFTFSPEEKAELIDDYVSLVDGLMKEASSDLDTKFENQEFFSGIVNFDTKQAEYQYLLDTSRDYLKELEKNEATTEQLAEYENSVVIPIIKKKRDLLKEQLAEQEKATEHYIKMREFYGYTNGDNEIKARERTYKRMLNLTQEQILAEYGTYKEYWYALEEERLEIDQIFRDKLKEALEKEKDDRIAILEAEKNAAEKLFEGENTLREKRKQINDQLQESLTMYQYLDKATRKLIFNEEDYLALSNTLNEIEEDMYDLNQKYLRDIVGKEADELEYINAEYERQNELLMNRYEIAEKELGVIKARTELENTLKERNTQMFINGRWQWVADQKAVIEAQKKLNDAEFDLETSELENEQELLINSFEKQIDNANQVWEKATKVLEDKVMTVAELMNSLSEPMDDLTAKFYELATGKKVTSRDEQKSTDDAKSKLAKDTALAIIRKKEEYDTAKAQGNMTKAQEIEEQAKASYQILKDLGYNELAEELHKSDLATAKRLNLDELIAKKQQTNKIAKQIENTENAVVEAIENIDISPEEKEKKESIDLKQGEKVSQIVNDIAWYKQAWEEGDEATRKEAEQNAQLLYDELKQLGKIELAEKLANSTYKESVEILNQINENIKKSNSSSSSSGGGGSSKSSMSGGSSSGGSGKSTISSSYTTPDGVSVQIGTNSNGDTVVYNNEGGHWHTVGIVPKVKGGKARGSRSVVKGFYEINEIGEETYVTPDGHFRNFAGGEVVFTHEQSQRLFSLLNADLFNINKVPRVGEFEQSNSNDTYISIGGISIDTTTQDGKDLVEILQRITNI